MAAVQSMSAGDARRPAAAADAPLVITCACGRDDMTGPGRWHCPACGRHVEVAGGLASFELVAGDLAYAKRNVLGWLLLGPLLVQWLAAYAIAGAERAGALFLAPAMLYFIVLAGFSDELRAAPLVTRRRPWAIGYAALQLAGWLALMLPWTAALVLAGTGLAVALAGAFVSLATTRPPMRFPYLVLDAWRMLWRQPRQMSAAQVTSQLPQTLVLLRSFPADLALVENADLEVGSNRLFIKITLEDAVRQFAAQNSLDVAKLGGESRVEGAVLVLADDEHWQEVARLLMERSAAILMVPGTTPGLAWELEQLMRIDATAQLIVWIFGNPLPQQTDAAWDGFRALAAPLGLHLPAFPTQREWQPMAARMTAQGLHLIAAELSSWTTGPCRRAFWFALARVLDLERGLEHHGPAPSA